MASISCSRTRTSFEIAESAMGMPSTKPVCSRQSVVVWMGGVTDMPALCIAPAGSIWCRWIRTAGRADGLVVLQTCTTFRCRHETSSPSRQAAENEQNVQSGWMIARAWIISQWRCARLSSSQRVFHANSPGMGETTVSPMRRSNALRIAVLGGIRHRPSCSA